MRSDLISRIEKANRYAGERNRVKFRSLTADFEGTHQTHLTSLIDGKWTCTCQFFAKWENVVLLL